jgi:hypothetical protein
MTQAFRLFSKPSFGLDAENSLGKPLELKTSQILSVAFNNGLKFTKKCESRCSKGKTPPFYGNAGKFRVEWKNAERFADFRVRHHIEHDQSMANSSRTLANFGLNAQKSRNSRGFC